MRMFSGGMLQEWPVKAMKHGRSQTRTYQTLAQLLLLRYPRHLVRPVAVRR